jgi:hypothetical protein
MDPPQHGINSHSFRQGCELYPKMEDCHSGKALICDMTDGMIFRLLRVILLFTTAGLLCGQCPLRFGKVNPNVTDSWSRVGRSMSKMNAHAAAMLPDFEVKVENASGKDIRGLKVQAFHYDATEDLHAVPIAWNWQSSIKAGTEKTLRWENPYYDTGFVGWLVVPIKVLFEDGTSWEAKTADSLGGCYGEFWRSKKHPRLTSLPKDLLKTVGDGNGQPVPKQ